MIVEQEERKVVTSIEMKRRRYRIDESGLVNILSILRKSMYSNPPRIIVQEYANNARDAHFDAKITDRPIQITCPTVVSPYLKIRDFGLGIPPELIDEVFVVYGASTKRHTNELIGGFGIGAKSAFSYCDAFEVTTICDGTKYIYAPHIDESNIGEMPLIAVEPTDEPSGTLISIPIQESDIYTVNNAITMVTEYWDVRPDVIGNLNYSNRKVYFSESNWALMEKSYAWQDNEIIYCVAGIPYNFEIPSDDERFTPELKELANCPFIVKLATGDVTIASNREALVSDDKTLNKVRDILQEINDHFKNHVMESIEKCDKLTEMFELRSMYNKLRLDHMVRSFVWKGIPITGNHLTIPPEVGTVHRIRLTKRGDEAGRGYSVKVSSSGDTIDFSEVTRKHVFTTCVEEGKTFNRNQLMNAMLTNTTLMECQLIILRVSEDDPILDQYGFQYFHKESLSVFPKKNLWRVKLLNGQPLPKIQYYDFVGPSNTPTNCWSRVEGAIGDLEEGVYFELYRGKCVDRYNYSFLNAFLDSCSLPIYGIPPRSMSETEENPNLISHKEYLKNYVVELRKIIDNNLEDASYVCGDHCDTVNSKILNISSITDNLPEDHLLAKWRRASAIWNGDNVEEVKTAVVRYNFFAAWLGYEPFTSDMSLHVIAELVKETYPMLQCFENSYRYRSDAPKEHILESALNYVNSIDLKISQESQH